jgi:hypothetical protein
MSRDGGDETITREGEQPDERKIKSKKRLHQERICPDCLENTSKPPQDRVKRVCPSMEGTPGFRNMVDEEYLFFWIRTGPPNGKLTATGTNRLLGDPGRDRKPVSRNILRNGLHQFGPNG